MAILVAHNTKAFDSADGVFDAHAAAGELFVFLFLLFSQLTAFRLLVWCADLRFRSDISLVAQAWFISHGRRGRCLMVNFDIGGGAAMPGIKIENLAVLIGYDLRLERMAFLFARIDALLALIERRTWNRRLETINDRQLDLIRRPGGFCCAPFLFRCPFFFGKQVAADWHDFVESILRGIGAEAEKAADDFVADVVAQVKERHHYFMHWQDLAWLAVVGDGRTLAIGTFG